MHAGGEQETIILQVMALTRFSPPRNNLRFLHGTATYQNDIVSCYIINYLYS